MNNERALVGGKEIAEYLRWPMPKLLARSKELQEAGALTIECFGRPPHRTRKMYTFPSLLQRYFTLKNNK